jgi:hypothetical protein
MNMIRNNLNRKENIKRANLFVKSITKYPCELVRINFSFDASTSNYEKITNQEIEFIIGKNLDFIKKIWGENYQKTGVVMFPDFEWDSNQFLHTVGVNFILTGKNLENKLKQLNLEISKLVNEKIGGEFTIEFIEDNSPEDVFIEVFPVQFESVLRDIDWFFTSSVYPKFYSRSMFDFITSPLTIFQTDNG